MSLSAHPGYSPGEAKPEGQANHRNGMTPKTALTDTGALPLGIPSGSDGSLRPQLMPTGVRQPPQFNAYMPLLFARWVSVRETQAHLKQLY